MRFSSGSSWRSRPFALKVKKETWSIATDGCLLFALKVAGAAPGTKVPKDDLLPMLSTPAKGGVEFQVAELRTWAGEVPAALVPPGDVGYAHHGALLGKVVDRRKLAYLIATIPFPVVTGWVYKDMGPAEVCIGLEGGNGQWRGFLACLDGAPDGEEPVFHGKKDGPLSVFDLAEEVGSE